MKDDEIMCGERANGLICTRTAGHRGQHAAREGLWSVALAVWGDPDRSPASTADAEKGEVAPAELHYGTIKMGRRLFATRYQPGHDDVEFWEAGLWKPYSIAELQRREAHAAALEVKRDGPVDRLRLGIFGRLGRGAERRRLRHRLVEATSELYEFVGTEAHHVEVHERLGPAGETPAARAAGRADGFAIAADLVARVIEELR